MNPTHDWQIDTHSMELVIRRDEADSVGVSLGHDSIDDAHGTTIITSRLLEMIDTVQPGAVRAYLSEQEPTDAEVEAAALSILADEGGFDLSDEDDAYHVHEIQWKDMDEGEMSGRLAAARAALSAARAGRAALAEGGEVR